MLEMEDCVLPCFLAQTLYLSTAFLPHLVFTNCTQSQSIRFARSENQECSLSRYNSEQRIKSTPYFPPWTPCHNISIPTPTRWLLTLKLITVPRLWLRHNPRLLAILGTLLEIVIVLGHKSWSAKVTCWHKHQNKQNLTPITSAAL